MNSGIAPLLSICSGLCPVLQAAIPLSYTFSIISRGTPVNSDFDSKDVALGKYFLHCFVYLEGFVLILLPSRKSVSKGLYASGSL